MNGYLERIDFPSAAQSGAVAKPLGITRRLAKRLWERLKNKQGRLGHLLFNWWLIGKRKGLKFAMHSVVAASSVNRQSNASR